MPHQRRAGHLSERRPPRRTICLLAVLNMSFLLLDLTADGMGRTTLVLIAVGDVFCWANTYSGRLCSGTRVAQKLKIYDNIFFFAQKKILK